MQESIVLLHGSATGASSWRRVLERLEPSGVRVFAPDMLGYGQSPAAGPGYGIAQEVAHLQSLLEVQGLQSIHLVAHSIGAMFGLHLRRALGARVTRLTLIDPVVVSVLREPGEDAGLAEMDAQYNRIMEQLPDHAGAARAFIEHWSGPGVWDAMGEKARRALAALAPKLRLEMIEAKSDTTPLAVLAESPPPTRILVGEKTLVAPRAVARQLERALRATCVIVPGAAHMIPQTHAQQVAQALGDGSIPGTRLVS
jgi:pimeloyl-ACP methyl ester carboxylesterase